MIRPSISVLLTGSEVLDGRVQDTNSNFIARTISDLGLRLEHFLSCDDELESIVTSLKFLLSRSTHVVISGGIGPTSDDLTREAVSELLNDPLVLNEDVLATLKASYAARSRIFDPSNTKQALFPSKASVIPNPLGTAAGFSAAIDLPERTSGRLFILPGVPSELERMFLSSVLPVLQREIGGTLTQKRGFRVFGLPESAVGARIKAVGIPSSIFVSYRAAFPEIHVLLKSTSPEHLADWYERALTAVGEEYIFTHDVSQPLDAIVGGLLKEHKLSIAVAESCTAGAITSALARYPGASTFLKGGDIVYTPEAKSNRLGVRADTIGTFEVVSSEVAREMAEGVKRNFSSDIGLSITGAFGPTGGTIKHPVGTYFIGISNNTGTRAYRFYLLQERLRVARYATWSALEVLRRTLLDIPVEESQVTQ